MNIKFLLVMFTVFLSLSSFAMVEENACVPNVLEQFNNLNPNGNNLAVRTAGVIPGRAFTQAPLAVFGLENHFQGIQRLHNKPYAVIAAADWWHKQGYLFVIRLGTKESVGEAPFGTNVSKKVMPAKEDRMVKRVKVGDKAHWHPGGLGSSGDILAITTEEYKKTEAGRILFYDFSNPEEPKLIPGATIERGNKKAGTADLFKQADGHFVAFTYTGGILSFYRSNTKNIADGFDLAGSTEVPHDGGGAVNVVKQCDGQLFLLSYGNSADIAPIQKGIDQAFITKLSFSNEIQNPKIEKIANGEITLNCSGYCNFGGAAGSFVSNDGNLSIYSSNFYRNYWGTKAKFKEFPQK